MFFLLLVLNKPFQNAKIILIHKQKNNIRLILIDYNVSLDDKIDTESH